MAKLSTDYCTLPSAINGQTLREVQLAMLQGPDGMKLAVTNSRGRGLEVRNHWQEGGVHYFAMRKKQRAWMYRLPDEEGEGGKVEFFIKVNGPDFAEGQRPKGKLTGRCKLKLLEAFEYRPRGGGVYGLDPLGQACAVGDTRECVGPAACKGGQVCLPDRSGYGRCDCGAAPVVDAGAEEPDVASDK